MTTETYSVQTIRDYLLGQLPEADAERLDELTVTDDEYAERVRAVEHDLVDAFARGELEGVVLEQFRSRYLTTPRRREATRFARALQSLDEHSEQDRSLAAGPEPATQGETTGRWRNLLPLAAVLVLAVASAWLALDNRTLRERATSAELERDRQVREVQAPTATDTARPPTGAVAVPLPVATLLLTPQLRSTRQLPTVALSGDGGEVPVQLDLEPVEYPAYEAALFNSNGGRLVWRSDRLSARTVGDRQRIDLSIPARVLRPADYLIRVSGMPTRGAPEIVGEYRFVVSK
jgi:anti-sigma factor RsiW